MQNILNLIKMALKEGGNLQENLSKGSTLLWQEEYPVAIVHEKIRVKDEEDIQAMETVRLFDKEGLTPHSYSQAQINFFKVETPSYLKTVSLMGMKKENNSYNFQEKFPHDYWKKVVNESEFQAIIEISEYKDENTCEIEAHLRDIMRSSKEVPSVKIIPFFWIATVAKSIDLSKILQHYFLENHDKIEQENTNIYIGFFSSLKEVNMRYFVCPPTS